MHKNLWADGDTHDSLGGVHVLLDSSENGDELREDLSGGESVGENHTELGRVDSVPEADTEESDTEDELQRRAGLRVRGVRLGDGLDRGVETYDVTKGVQSNSEPTLKSDGQESGSVLDIDCTKQRGQDRRCDERILG